MSVLSSEVEIDRLGAERLDRIGLISSRGGLQSVFDSLTGIIYALNVWALYRRLEIS